MFKIWLIRHGMTAGNLQGRYIGKTDEHLCEQGRKALAELSYPEPDEIFVSPMIRCRETAEILFPGKRFRIIDQLAETDFGDFENKNYRELAGNPQYQQWVDSGGNLPFPGGESREEFSRRTLEGFQRVLTACARENKGSAAVIAHGGTIMTLMEAFGYPRRDFYSWHVKNGHCYLVETDLKLWQSGRQIMEVREEI